MVNEHLEQSDNDDRKSNRGRRVLPEGLDRHGKPRRFVLAKPRSREAAGSVVQPHTVRHHLPGEERRDSIEAVQRENVGGDVVGGPTTGQRHVGPNCLQRVGESDTLVDDVIREHEAVSTRS